MKLPQNILSNGHQHWLLRRLIRAIHRHLHIHILVFCIPLVLYRTVFLCRRNHERLGTLSIRIQLNSNVKKRYPKSMRKN